MEFQHSRQKNAQLSRFHVTICLMSQCLSKLSNPSLLVISCPFFSLFHFFTLCRKVKRLSSSNSCTCLSSYEVHSLCRGQRVAQIVRNVLDTDVAMLCQPASKQHYTDFSHLYSPLISDLFSEFDRAQSVESETKETTASQVPPYFLSSPEYRP